MQGKHQMKDLVRTADLSPEDFFLVLGLAERVKEDRGRHHKDVRGEAVVLYFDTPSTRTRQSFEAAVTRMGGLPIAIEPGELEMGSGETIEDTAGVLSRFARAIVHRTSSDDDLRLMAGAAGVPVINGMSDLHHPCQSLADLMTVESALPRAGPGGVRGDREQRAQQPAGGLRAHRRRPGGGDTGSA